MREDGDGVKEPQEIKKFEVSAAELTPYDESLKTAREMAISRLPYSASRSEHMALTHAARVLTPTRSGWAEEYYDETPKPEELLEEHVSEETLKEWEEEQRRATELLEVAMSTEAEGGDFRVAVARYGDGLGAQYRAVGIYPVEEQARYDLPRSDDRLAQHDVIYITLNAVCNGQAVEDILRQAGEDAHIAGLVLPDIGISELHGNLGFDTGPKQNLRFRDAEGQVTDSRDAKQYIMFALKGGFGNEQDRYLLSDYQDQGEN